MLNRLYFSRSLTFVLKERQNVLPARGIFEFTRNFGLKSEQLHRNNLLTWSCSKVVFPKTNLLARFGAISSVIIRRSYRSGSNSSNKAWKVRLWTVVRGILLTTGGMVWAVAFTAYMALDRVTVDVLENEHGSGGNVFQKKLAEHFYQEKSEAAILRKENVLRSVWQKLGQEEQVKEMFGQPVFICGYNYKFMSDLTKDFAEKLDSAENDITLSEVDDREMDKQVESGENDDEKVDELVWEAGCYIEGPKKMGVMNVKFELYNQEWVPVSLRLETIETTGQVVSNVSGSLPNGIKNFTRLSN